MRVGPEAEISSCLSFTLLTPRARNSGGLFKHTSGGQGWRRGNARKKAGGCCCTACTADSRPCPVSCFEKVDKGIGLVACVAGLEGNLPGSRVESSFPSWIDCRAVLQGPGSGALCWFELNPVLESSTLNSICAVYNPARTRELDSQRGIFRILIIR